MKFDLIVADPPWAPKDSLTMSKVKRGAASQYNVLSTEGIKNLDIASLAKDNSVLALWVPSFMLDDGLEVMQAWGFKQKQIAVWVKTKKEPLASLTKGLRLFKQKIKVGLHMVDIDQIKREISEFDLNDNILQMFMGHLFRSCHEIVLIGTKGSVYSKMKNRSQRTVFMAPNPGHSSKPEIFQDRLEKIFPKANKLEIFARRDRENWTCCGLECPSTIGEDIKDSIKRIKAM